MCNQDHVDNFFKKLSIKPANYKVVECNCKYANPSWKFYRPFSLGWIFE